MNEQLAWNVFSQSGKILDYINYVNAKNFQQENKVAINDTKVEQFNDYKNARTNY